MKYRVAISGSYGGMNLGDEAILEGILKELRSCLDVDVVVFSRNPKDTEKRHKVRALPIREIHKDEVLKELKKHPSTRHIPVLLLTNLGQESIIREAFSLGAEGFLLKSELVPKQILQELDDFFSGKKTKESYLREFGAE